MALRLKDLQNARKECTVTLEEGVSFKVIYNPNKISASMLNQAGEGLNNLCESLAKILVTWELLEEDEKPMEVTVDNLKSLNLLIINKIFEAVLTDAFPKAK